MSEMSDAEYAAELKRNAQVIQDFLREHGQESLAQHLHVAVSLVDNLKMVELALQTLAAVHESYFGTRNAPHPMDHAHLQLLIGLVNRALNAPAVPQ